MKNHKSCLVQPKNYQPEWWWTLKCLFLRLLSIRMWEVITSNVSSLNKSSTRQLVRYWCATSGMALETTQTGSCGNPIGFSRRAWSIPGSGAGWRVHFHTGSVFFRLAQLVRAPVAHQLTFLAPHRRPRTGPTKKCVNPLTMRICQDRSYFWDPKHQLVRNSDLPSQTQAG